MKVFTMFKDIILDDFKDITYSSFKMPLIVVYKKPEEYPNKFVARLWDRDNPTRYIVLADDFETMRELKPRYMIVVEKAQTDDKKIVETWL